VGELSVPTGYIMRQHGLKIDTIFISQRCALRAARLVVCCRIVVSGTRFLGPQRTCPESSGRLALWLMLSPFVRGGQQWKKIKRIEEFAPYATDHSFCLLLRMHCIYAAPTKAISGHSGLWVTEEGVIVGFSCTRCGFEVAAIDKDECPSCFARVHGTTSYSAAWHEDKKQYHLQLAFRFTDWNSQKEALLIERCSDS
jgi:hypothetical protein